MPGNQTATKGFIYPLSIALLLLSETACTNASQVELAKQNAVPETKWIQPAAGSIIAADSMEIKDDPLNKSQFVVKIRVPDYKSSSNPIRSIYEVRAHYGVAEANGTISMPKGGDHLMPILRKGKDHRFIIGFIPGKEYGGDTSFHEYYQVEGEKGMITIKALKGFQIQQ